MNRKQSTACLSIVGLIAGVLQLTSPAAGQVGNVHTTFSGDPRSEVTVSWRTPPFGGTSIDYGPTTDLGNTATGTHFLSSGGYQHHVTLSGLQADTTYYYKPANGGPLGSFKTAPAGSAHFRFGVVGDVQGYEAISQKWRDASDFLAEQDILFWMPLGDLVQEGGVQAQYDAFWGGCPTLSQSVPIMPIIGNHDRYGYDAGWPQNYLDQFRMPNNGDPDYDQHWYEFEIGDMHFAAMNSTPEGGPLTWQEARVILTDWLEDVTSQTDKKWKFASRHPPLYSTGGHGGENLNPELTAIWDQYHATAVFTGHTHSFEVTHPIYGGALADSFAEGTLYYNSAGINSNGAVSGDWFSEFWQDQSGVPLVGVVDVYPDEVIVTTYNYQDGSVYHQVTISDPAVLPGDANGDGSVTDADYTIWADNYGATGATQDMGDFNGDGQVTDADYTIWADNYGATGGSVPEPTTIAILILGAVMGPRRKR